MKKLILSLLCGLAFINGYCEDTFYGPTNFTQKTFEDITIFGPAKLYQVKLNSLTVMGTLEFNEIDVKGDAEIKGAVANSRRGKFGSFVVIGLVKAEYVEAKKLKVVGPANISYFNVKGDADFVGPLEASKCSFNDLTVTAREIKLDDVQAKNIYIKSEDDDVVQTLYLGGNTLVEGDIVFKSKNGNIVMQGKGVQVNGEIKGVKNPS